MPAALWMRPARAWWNRRVTYGWRRVGERPCPSAQPGTWRATGPARARVHVAASGGSAGRADAVPRGPGGGSGTGGRSVPQRWAPVAVPGSGTINGLPAVLVRPRSVRLGLAAFAAAHAPAARPAATFGGLFRSLAGDVAEEPRGHPGAGPPGACVPLRLRFIRATGRCWPDSAAICSISTSPSRVCGVRGCSSSSRVVTCAVRGRVAVPGRALSWF